MATIGLHRISLRRAVLTVAGDDYRASVNQVELIPEPLWEWESPLEADPMRGAYPVLTGVRWTVLVGFVQDFRTPDSLSVYLVEHAAQIKTVTFTPDDGGRTVTVDVMILPARLGGVTGDILTAVAELPAYGAPDLGE